MEFNLTPLVNKNTAPEERPTEDISGNRLLLTCHSIKDKVMTSSEDTSSAYLRQSFWRSYLLNILICLMAGITLGIYQSSLLLGVLTYFLLSFMLTGLLVFRLSRKMAQELSDY